jgi:hypothetical protein
VDLDQDFVVENRRDRDIGELETGTGVVLDQGLHSRAEGTGQGAEVEPETTRGSATLKVAPRGQ